MPKWVLELMTPDDSALLDIKASDKGLLIPRVTIENLSNALPITTAPEESLLVYNITTKNEVTDNNGTVTEAGIAKGYYYWDSTAWVSISNPATIGKNVTSTDGSITGIADNAALVAMNLEVNVDDATIEINTTNGIQIKNGGVTKDKILDGAVAPLKIHGDIAGAGLTRSATGVLSVSIGGTDAEGNEIRTGTESDPGAGQNVTSDGSITVTNGSGAAFTEMGLKVNVDGATIEVDGTSKKVQIKNGAVTTDKILDNAVTKDKILDGAVAPLKIHGDIAGAGLARDR